MAPKGLKRPRKKNGGSVTVSVESSNSCSLKRRRQLKSSKKLKINPKMMHWMEGSFTDTYLNQVNQVVSGHNHGIEGPRNSVTFWEGFTEKLNNAINNRGDMQDYPGFSGYSIEEVVEYGKFLRSDFHEQLKDESKRKPNYELYKLAFGRCSRCPYLLAFPGEATLKRGKRSKGSSSTSRRPSTSGGSIASVNNSDEVASFISRVTKLRRLGRISPELSRAAIDILGTPEKANYRLMFMALPADEQVQEIEDLCSLPPAV